MDGLDEVLGTARVGAARYFQQELTETSTVRVRDSEASTVHALLAGACTFRLTSESELTLLQAGDVIAVPQGQAHELFTQGGSGAVLASGQLHFLVPRPHPLLSALPTRVVLRGDGGRPPHGLGDTLGMLAWETRELETGSDTVVRRLSDVLMAQLIGGYLACANQSLRGWLAALVHPHIGLALRSIHRAPGSAFTVESLASEAGMGRSTFAWRFAELVGEPPLRYVVRWRMYQAASLLRESRQTLTDVATHVGYASDAAFSRAFKRWVGSSPGSYRRRGIEPYPQTKSFARTITPVYSLTERR